MKLSKDKDEPLLPRDSETSNSFARTPVKPKSEQATLLLPSSRFASTVSTLSTESSHSCSIHFSDNSREKANKEGMEIEIRTPISLIPYQNNAPESAMSPLASDSEELIDFPADVSGFSLKAQAFLTSTGITTQDLRNSRIKREIIEQLLNASLTRRSLRWLALENLIQKSFLFPLLDERGIQNAEIRSNSSNCRSAFLEWCTSRTWPRAQSLPFRSETMVRRAYAIDDFFDGVESIITRFWTLLLASFLSNDYYNYYAYPDERYGATPAGILFKQGENERVLVTYLSRPEHWYGFLMLLGIPLGWGIVKAIRSSVCCPITVNTERLKELQDFFHNYKEGNFCRETYEWLMPFSESRNKIEVTRQILLWNNQITPDARLNLYQAFQTFSRRTNKLAQFFSIDLLSDIADSIAIGDFIRLSRLGAKSEELQSLLANKAHALQELQKWARYYQTPLYRQDNNCYTRYLKPLIRYLVTQYLLWCLGQPKSNLLQPLFWGFKGAKLLVKANFVYLLYQGIAAALQLYYRKQSCEQEEKNWRFINEIGDYNCTICADFPIPYPYTFTMRSCLDDYLRVSRNTSDIIRLFDRVRASDNITVLDLSNQHFADTNGTNDLIQIMPVIEKRFSQLRTFLLNHTDADPSFLIGPSGAEAIAAFLPKSKLKLLDLTNNNIGDNGTVALASTLPNSNLQNLNLVNNQIGVKGAAAIGAALPNSNLQTLFLNKNSIGNSGVAAISEALKNSSLQTLVLANTGIGSSAATVIASALPNSKLLALTLTNNNIDSIGATAISTVLPNSKLQLLRLSGNYIEYSGAAAIGAALPNSNLHSLDLSSNNIGDEGAIGIGKGVPSSKLQNLLLDFNNIGDSGVAIIAEGLSNSSLQTLTLSYNNIGDFGTAAISSVLTNSKLQVLDLGSNNIGDEGAMAIGKGLPNSKLQTLDLYFNDIGAEGAAAIGSGLPNSSLQYLSLFSNNIGSKGAAAIGKRLSDSNLQILDLSLNNIESEGVVAISTHISNSSLLSLYLIGSNIGRDGATAIATSLLNSKLQFLTLNECNIGSEDVIAISTGLSNSNLQTLNLGDNNIDDSGATAMALALLNSKLQVLNLFSNNISSEGAAAISASLPSSRLHTLNLDDNSIGNSGAKAIANNLVIAPRRSRHRLWLNLLDPNDRPILDTPKSNTQLTSLHLSNTHINDSGAEALCQALPWTEISFVYFDLAHNNIDSSVVQDGLCVTSNGFSLKAPLPIRLFYQSMQFILQPIHSSIIELKPFITSSTISKCELLNSDISKLPNVEGKIGNNVNIEPRFSLKLLSAPSVSFVSFIIPLIFLFYLVSRLLPIFSHSWSTPQNKRDLKVKKKQQIKPKQGVQKCAKLPIEDSNLVQNNTAKTAVKISKIVKFETKYQFTPQNSMTSLQHLPQCSTAVLEEHTKKKKELHRIHETHHLQNCSHLLNDSNNSQKQYELALKYLHGKSAKHNLEQALELLLQSAKLGNVEAMYEMGDCYLSGTGFKQDDKKAAEWFALAAKRGHSPAQLQMGYLYAGGYGVEKNQKSAMYWFKLAAKAGDARAQSMLNKQLKLTIKQAHYKISLSTGYRVIK